MQSGWGRLCPRAAALRVPGPGGTASGVRLFQACQLPLFSYIVERLCACCYEQAWYAKLGGVVSIKFLMERLPLTWVLQNQQTFLKALLFVMMDLTGEVGGEGSAGPGDGPRPDHMGAGRSLAWGTVSLRQFCKHALREA